MPPVPVRKRGPIFRQRLVSGLTADPSAFSSCLQKDECALIGPKTQLVCKCCFCVIEDISQHISTKSACALFMGAKHVCVSHQENGSDKKPDVGIICCMFLDKKCLVDVQDVIHQGEDWNPDDDFVCRAANGHRLDPRLLTKSFTQLCDAHKASHPTLDVDVPDVFTKGATAATSVKNLNKKLAKEWNEQVELLKATFMENEGAALVDKVTEKLLKERSVLTNEDFEISVECEATHRFNELMRNGKLLPSNEVEVRVAQRVQEKVDNGALVKARDMQRMIEEHIEAEVQAGRLIRQVGSSSAGASSPLRPNEPATGNSNEVTPPRN
jgi:hypothetical protein